jgi:hypothetical protein
VTTDAPTIEMKTLIIDRLGNLIAAIELTGVPALPIGFTAAVAVFAAAGVFIWRRRHQFFDRDPEVEDDFPAVRYNREESHSVRLERTDPRLDRYYVGSVECVM